MRDNLRRRAILAGVGTALTGAVAGCGGDGDANEADDPADDSGTPTVDDAGGPTANDAGGAATDAPTDGESMAAGGGGTATDGSTASGPNPTRTPPTSKEEMGTLVQDVIGEIRFLGWRSEAGGMGVFNVFFHLQNDGDQPLHLDGYTWGVVPYDEDGEEMTVSAEGPILAEYEEPLAPGASGQAAYHVRVDDANDVASYDIHLSCDGYDADGAYCPE